MKREPAVAFAAALLASTALAVPVEKWVQTSQADFEPGEAKGVSILSLGQLALAPDIKPLAQEAVPHVWALAADPKGTLYAATGTEAKVLRFSGGKAETFFTSPVKTDLEILAIALGPDGAIYASAAPSGTLYRIAPDGKGEAHYKGEDPYIWALAIAPDGKLYAATGPNGKVLRIAAKDKADTLLKAGSRHILSLALAPDGSLYAGSDKDGFLYHISPKGESRVVYDAEEPDIRAMAFDAQGRLYFATAGTPRQAAPTPPSTTASPMPMRMLGMLGRGAPDEGGTSPESASTTSPQPSPAPAAPGAKVSSANAIYRVTPDGNVTRVATVTGAAFYSLLWHNNRLLAGTGNDGKLYAVEGNQAVRLANLDESQITSLIAAQGRILLATANSGRVFQVAADHTPTGTFVSQVHDSQSLSRWGVATWDAKTPDGTSITLATRSGNVATPDETWSAWSDELARPEGAHILSPPARFIQYRLTLKTSSPNLTLNQVVLSYAQSNHRPVISQVQLQTAPRPRRQLPMPMPQPGQPAAPQPMPAPAQPPAKKQTPTSPRGPFADLVRISWQATDPNKDDMVYSVYFRGEDETTWKKLQERVNATFHDWDTHAVPDGLYRIRVVASDSPTNPPDQALETEKITEPFLVDNTPPTVTALAVQLAKDKATLRVTAKGTDAGSGLNDGQYSIDGGDWVSVRPVDGIFDSTAEALDFTIPIPAKGEHTIVVRVADQAENTGAAKCVFNIQ